MAKKKSATPKLKNSTRKRGGGKLARSEIVQVRLDQKLRFAAELAARKQRRTLSSFIEWAIDEILNDVKIPSSGAWGKKPLEVSAHEAIQMIWDVNEADRFIKLVHAFPNLLTHDEERIWGLIIEFQAYWLTDKDKDLDVEKSPEKIDFSLLRIAFPYFKQFSKAEIDSTTMFHVLDKYLQ
jgi:hypothetical protein